MANNQKEKLFSNKFIQKFLDNQSPESLNNKNKFVEIASSLAYYLKSFSNINKLIDYICLIFKHIFKEKIILIMPLDYAGEIWNENIKNGTFIKEIDKRIELLANQQDDNHKKTEALLAKIDSRLSLSFVLKAIVITLSLILMVFIWKYKHIITRVTNSAPNQGKER